MLLLKWRHNQQANIRESNGIMKIHNEKEGRKRDKNNEEIRQLENK